MLRSTHTGRTGDHLIAGWNEALDINIRIKPDRLHKGQVADILLGVSHVHAGTETLYLRDGPIWKAALAELPAAGAYVALPYVVDISVDPKKLGELTGHKGEFVIYAGYRLPDGTIVYTSSELLRLLVANSSMLDPGLALLPDASYAYFAGIIRSESGRQGNPLEVPQHESVDISAVIHVDARHIGLHADLLMVAIKTGSALFSQDWNRWDSQLKELNPAQAGVQLNETLWMPVFQGKPAPGDYTVYLGYRLPDGTIVFNGMETINLTVTPSK
ncbi:MAG: hypothetical protein GY862_35585 [Gammaproteobacteria bacterium]|nr:hypothetical protein [Gammaproteobacteria bacterium]